MIGWGRRPPERVSKRRYAGERVAARPPPTAAGPPSAPVPARRPRRPWPQEPPPVWWSPARATPTSSTRSSGSSQGAYPVNCPKILTAHQAQPAARARARGLDPQARFGRSGQGRLSGTRCRVLRRKLAGRYTPAPVLRQAPADQADLMSGACGVLPAIRSRAAPAGTRELSLVLRACQLDEHGPEDGVSLHAHATYPLVFQLQHACPIGVCSSIPVLGPHH